MATVDLLLHPVRLRLVQAFLGDRTLTTADLRSRLPDVPLATLYRQVALLAEAGILVVAAERKVRGTVERSYRLDVGAASVGPDEAAAATVEQHRRAFVTFVAALLADFDRYLARADVDLGRDGVGYRQAGMWLTDEEFAALVDDLRTVLRPRMANQPDGDRRRRVVSTILMPVD